MNDGSPTVKQAAEKPWMKHLGKLKHLRKETKRIDKRIEAVFEQIDPELWKPVERS